MGSGEEEAFMKYEVRSILDSKQTYKVAHGGYCYTRDKVKKDAHYYYCDHKTCKAYIVWRNGNLSFGKTHWNDDGTHFSHLPDKDKVDNEAALDKLNKLTLSGHGCRKVIDIVRQFLKETPPQILSQMPSVSTLIQKVRRFATKNNIKLLKSGPEDFFEEYTTDAPVSSNEVVKTGIVYFDPDILVEEQSADANNRGAGHNHNQLSNPISPTATISKQVNAEILRDYDDDFGHNDNDLGDHCCDNQMDHVNEHEADVGGVGEESELFNPSNPSKISSHVITTSSVPSTSNKSSHKNATTSGERCFVCGDELIISEPLSSPSETFKKACRYLNVKSEMNWFPGNGSSNIYSFCESCSNEITNIHGLYRKVEEFQSLIFRKVESVEKRIADAEIVDNWMAEVPPTTTLRYEGFRKQVMINYRNKLKLRRAIRFGNKTGQPLVEATPGIPTHMFARDPLESQDPPRSSPNEPATSSKPSFPLTRHKTSSKMKLPEDAPDDQEDGFLDDSQEDATSASSELWESYPSRVDIDTERQARKRKIRKLDEDYVEEENADNESDLNYEEEEEDEECEAKNNSIATDLGPLKKGRGKPRKVPSSAQVVTEPIEISKHKAKGNERIEKPGSSLTPGGDVLPSITISNKCANPPRKKKPKIQFPECVFTKEGRIFMEGVEILKNPPGTYKPRPLEPSFSCGNCNKIVCGFYHIRLHIGAHHLAMFKCPKCPRKCPDPRTLRHHMASVHKHAKLEECPICGKPIKVGRNEAPMKFHQWMHLSAEEKEDPQYSHLKPIKEMLPPHKQILRFRSRGKDIYKPGSTEMT